MGINVRVKKSDINFWQQPAKLRVKVDGVWRPLTYGATKVNGKWEPFYADSVKRFSETHDKDSITFTWDQIPGVTIYELWVSNQEYGSKGLSFVKQPNITPTLSSGKHSYNYITEREKDLYFYIVPIIGSTPGFRSGYIFRMTPVGPPPPITDLQFISNDPKNGSFKIRWTPNSRYNISNYNYYDDGGSPYQYTVTGTSGQNTIIVKNQLDVNTTTGIDIGWGVSGTGISAGAKITNINTLTKVITLSANNTSTVSGFIIFYPQITFKNKFSSSDGTYTKIISGGENVEYKIKIEAFNSLLESSGLSNQVEYQYSPISYVNLFRSKLNGTATGWNTLDLSWTGDSANVDHYDLLYTTGTVYSPLVAGIAGTSSSASVSFTSASTLYKIKLVAYAKTLPGVIWKKTPVESTTIVNFTTGTPASSSTVRTDGTNTQDYTGTNRRRIVTTVTQTRFGNARTGYYYLETSRTSGSSPEAVSYGEGGFYDFSSTRNPVSSSVYYPVPGTPVRRQYFLTTYGSYVSNYYENFNNSYVIDSVLQNPSYGGTRKTDTAPINKITSTVSGGNRRSKITVSYHYNTTTTIVAVTGTVSDTPN